MADEPPALHQLPAQIAAVGLSHVPDQSLTHCQASIPCADVCPIFATKTKIKGRSGTLKRGFFNSCGRKHRSLDNDRGEPSSCHPQDVSPQDINITKKNDIVTLTKRDPKGTIPDCFIVEPDAMHPEFHKQRLLDAIKPTTATVSAAMENPVLSTGFSDPEVMAAVEEIGRDPSLIRTKFASNAKVANFYRAMAGHVGEQLSNMRHNS